MLNEDWRIFTGIFFFFKALCKGIRSPTFHIFFFHPTTVLLYSRATDSTTSFLFFFLDTRIIDNNWHQNTELIWEVRTFTETDNSEQISISKHLKEHDSHNTTLSYSQDMVFPDVHFLTLRSEWHQFWTTHPLFSASETFELLSKLSQISGFLSCCHFWT